MGSLFRRTQKASSEALSQGERLSQKVLVELKELPSDAVESEFQLPDVELGLAPQSACRGLNLVVLDKKLVLLTSLGVGLVPNPLPSDLKCLEIWEYPTRQGLTPLVALASGQLLLVNRDSRVRKLVVFETEQNALWRVDGIFDEEHEARTLLGKGSDIGWSVNWNSRNKGYEPVVVSHLVSLRWKVVRECREQKLKNFDRLKLGCTFLKAGAFPEIHLARDPETGVMEEIFQKIALRWVGEPRWKLGVKGDEASLYGQTFPDDSARFAVWFHNR